MVKLQNTVRFDEIRLCNHFNLMTLLFQTVLNLAEFMLNCRKKSKKFTIFGKNCKSLSVLGIWKNLQKHQIFAKSCRNLKVLASFLVLLI